MVPRANFNREFTMFDFITRAATILDGQYAIAVSNYDRIAAYLIELGYPLSMIPARYTDEPRLRTNESDIDAVRKLISPHVDHNFFIGSIHNTKIKLENNALYERFPPLKDKLVFVENPYHMYYNLIRLGRNNPEGLDMVPILIEYLDKTSPDYIDRMATVGFMDYTRIKGNPKNDRERRVVQAFERKQKLLDIAVLYRSGYLGSSDAHPAFVEWLKTSDILPK